MENNAIDLASKLCRAFEGYRRQPYLCPAGVATIGYGSTHYPDGTKVTLNDPATTKTLAESYLLHELSALAPTVARLCPGLNPNRFAALLDFAYNLGTGRLRASTLRRKVNAGDWDGAKSELMRWNRGGGRILPGLTRRRIAEAVLLA